MEVKIYDRDGDLKAAVSPGGTSTTVKEIQGDSVMTLSFEHWDYISLDVDDYVDFEGERFWLTEQYRPRQNARKKWVYEVKFYGTESMLKRLLVIKRVDGEDEAEFTLTAPAREHVAMIVGCMNEGLGNITDWKVGQVDGTENIVIDYIGKYCDEALREIAEKVGGEAWVDGETVNVCRCEHGEAIAMGYDKGLLSIEADRADNVKFYTRLYPIGSRRNIDAERYGHSRLQLPGGAKYVEMNADKYSRVDHYEKEAFAGIYPRRTGTVSSVRSEEKTGTDGEPFTIYYFKDSGLDFDPNDYEIGGLVKRVSFQEGSELGGLGDEEDGTYYFEVNFNSSTREFEIITIWPYDDGRQLPGEGLVPKVGDKYILWNLRMPDEYYAAAEAELLEAVEQYNGDHNLDIAVYKAPTDHVWIEDNNIKLTIGQRIRLESEEYFPERGYRDSRITRITRKVELPTMMDIEISDALSRTSLEKVTDSIKDVRSYAKSLAESTSLPDIIKTGDRTKPTDTNLLSALRAMAEFLSKTGDDRTRGKVASDKGFEVGDYQAGVSGGILGIDAETGESFAEVMKLFVRGKAYFESLTLIESNTLAGKQYITPGGAIKCTSVEEVKNGKGVVTAYRCYFLSEQDGEKTETKIIAGDQAISERFNAKPGTANKVSNHRYWRLVTAVENDALSDESGNHYGYVELSATDCETGSDAPQAGDVIEQFGYRGEDKKERQSAMVLSTVDADSPSIKLLTGINNYTTEGRDIISQGRDPLTGKAYFKCYGDHYVGARDGSAFVRYDDAEKKFEQRNVTQRTTAIIDGVERVMSGINGTYDPALSGRTIASWWGGDMIDLFDKNDKRITPEPINAATALKRLDGSGYEAKGAFIWDALGNPKFGSGVKVVLGDNSEVDLSQTFTSFLNFIANLSQGLVPAKKKENGEEELLSWERIDEAQYLLAKYTLVSLGDLQSKKYVPVEGNGNGGSASAIELLTQWTDYTVADKDWLGLSAGLGVELHNRLTLLEGQVAGGLSVDLTGYATQDWVNNQGFVKASDLTGYATQQWVNNQGFLKAVAWGDVSGKPSWIGASKPSYNFSEIGSKPTTLAGYGITDAYTKTEADGRFLGINATAKAAEKLATTSIYTAWGQTFFENGVPKSISGDMTNVGNITASGGKYKFLTYPTSLYGLVLSMNSSGCVLMQSQRAANDSEVFPIALNPLGGNVGIGTTSPAYKLDVNGVARVSELKLGKFTFTDKGDYVEFDGTILALGDVQSKKHANIAGGGTGDGGDFSIMSSWDASLANDPDYVLSAGLGYNLHITKLDKTEAEGLYQPKGDYLTSITKSQVEAVLTGNITSHHHSAVAYIDRRSTNPLPFAADFAIKGIENALKYNYADSLSDGGAYHSAMTIHPWNDSSGGAAHQLGFTDNGNIYHRYGTSSWSSWQKVLTDVNYASVLDNKYVTLGTEQTITRTKTFTHAYPIFFKHSVSGKGLYFEIHENGSVGFFAHTNGSWTSSPYVFSIDGSFNATKFVKSGGTSSQFLKADGSVDSNKYIPYSTASLATVNGTNSNPQIFNIENENLISGYNNYWSVINLGSYSGDNYRSQIAMPYQNTCTDTDMFIRTANSSTWRTWRRVLHDGNYASILDNAYVKKSGDMMTGVLTIETPALAGQLKIKRSVNGNSLIEFANSERTLGYIGVGGGSGSFPYDAMFMTLDNEYRIWHSGNDGSGSGLDADLLDGVHKTSLFRENLLSVQNLDANNLTSNWVCYTPNSDMNTWGNTTFTNFPTARPDGGFCLLYLKEGNYAKQLYTKYNDNHLYIRGSYYSGGNIAWKSWSTLAFLTDNVASASKLATARNFAVADYDGSHTGEAVSFDGTAAATLKLPNAIKCNTLTATNSVTCSIARIGTTNDYGYWFFTPATASSNGALRVGTTEQIVNANSLVMSVDKDTRAVNFHKQLRLNGNYLYLNDSKRLWVDGNGVLHFNGTILVDGDVQSKKASDPLSGNVVKTDMLHGPSYAIPTDASAVIMRTAIDGDLTLTLDGNAADFDIIYIYVHEYSPGDVTLKYGSTSYTVVTGAFALVNIGGTIYFLKLS